VTLTRSSLLVSWVLVCATGLAGAAGENAKDKDTAPAMADPTVMQVGENTVKASEVQAELAYVSPEILAGLVRDQNAARLYAFDWYSRRLFELAAAKEGLFERKPGLRDAADALGRRLIAGEYITDRIASEYEPTAKELRQYYAVNKKTACVQEARFRVARAGVMIPPKAGPQEIEGAKKRLAEMQRRLEDGESFSTVADEASDLPGRLPGGELGWLTERQHGASPGFAEIRALHEGDWTKEPVKTREGLVLYYMIELDGGGVRSFDDCASDLERSFVREYRRELVLRRAEELATELDASLNMDAFIAAAHAAGAEHAASDGPP